VCSDNPSKVRFRRVGRFGGDGACGGQAKQKRPSEVKAARRILYAAPLRRARYRATLRRVAPGNLLYPAVAARAVVTRRAERSATGVAKVGHGRSFIIA
jgi:hypothetical protein